MRHYSGFAAGDSGQPLRSLFGGLAAMAVTIPVFISPVLLFATSKDPRRSLQNGVEFRTHRQFFSVRGVNSNADEMFTVPKSLNNSPQPAGTTALQNRLDCFFEAFRQDLRPSFKVGPQRSFFGSNLAAGNYKRDQRDSYGEDWNQAKAKLHTVPSLREKAAENRSMKTFFGIS